MTSTELRPACGGRTGLGNVLSVAQQDIPSNTSNILARQAARIAFQCRVTPALARTIAALHYGELRA